MGVLFATVGLLVISNVFMTLAWYGHLGGQQKDTWTVLAFIADLKNRPWFLAVLVSWAVAFVEYLFQVPANRIGSADFSKAQLKIMQEVISLGVFVVIAIVYWQEKVTWDYLWAALCILAAVFFIFRAKDDGPVEPVAAEVRKVE